MPAALIGFAGGAVLTVLLFRIVKVIGAGGKTPVVPLLAFLLVPLAVLLAVAFTAPRRLVLAATVMVAVMLAGSAAKIIADKIKKRRKTQ